MSPDEQLAELRAELDQLQAECRDRHTRIDVLAAGIATLLRRSDGPTPGAAGALTERIVELLSDGQARSPSEITAALETLDPTVQANAVRATLSQLLTSGRVERPARGRYGVPSP